MDNFDGLAELAKAHEPDRYASTLLIADPAARSAVLAVVAFSAELRRIPLVVTEPMMGEIRLQWWRDILNSVPASPATPVDQTSGAGAHPIAGPLLQAIAARALPRASLLAMTEARSVDLYPDPLPDTASFDAYLMRTEGLVFDVAARAAGHTNTPQAVISAAARAYGLARHVSALPYALARGRLPVALPQLTAAGVDVDALLAGQWSASVGRLVHDLLNDAQIAYDAARPLVAALPRDIRAVFLPLALVPTHIKMVRDRGATWLIQPAAITPIIRHWRLWRAHVSGKP